ncbi:MAG: hypothetical protein AB1762_07315 [Gemmatimonadota bacterium]
MTKRDVLNMGAGLLALLAPAHLCNGQVTELRLAAPNATLPTEFTRVTAVRALSDGRLLVADAGETKLYVVDFAKQTATAVGRSGRGPNEYAALTALFPLSNDSTLLPDPRAGRWLLLHGAEVVAMVPPDSPPIRSGARTLFGASADGFVLATASARNFEQGGSFTTGAADSTWILRVSRSTGDVDSVAKARSRAGRVNVTTSGGRPQRVEIVMNPISVGEQALLFQDGWLAIVRLEPYRVDWIAPGGRMIRGAELPDRKVRIDDRAKAWILEELAERSGRASRSAADVADWPEVIPPFESSALLAAPDGTVWIRKAATEPNARVLYDVVDRQGRLVRRVSMAQNERLVGFGQGALFVVSTDDDGIHRLQRHAMPR